MFTPRESVNTGMEELVNSGEKRDFFLKLLHHKLMTKTCQVKQFLRTILIIANVQLKS